MERMGRKAFPGLAGLGALTIARSGLAAEGSTSEYTERMRPPAGAGLGKGEGASLSVVWLPEYADTPLPALKARLVIFDLDGKLLAEQETSLAPFTGAAVEFVLPAGVGRKHVFGYVFVDERLNELFGAFEVFDVSSGRSRFAGPVPIA